MTNSIDAKSSSYLDRLAYDQLGLWNIYFLAKFALYYLEIIDFHVLENTVFIAFLLLPISNSLLLYVKNILGVIVALLLLHHDSYFPPLSRLLSSGDLLSHFSFAYLFELAGRFVSWQILALGFVGIFAYVFLVKWVRFTTVSIVVTLYLGFASLFTQQQQSQTTLAVTQPARSTLEQEGIANTPEQQINQFYQQQKTLQTTFPKTFAGDNFDVVMLNICSLGWDDLKQVNLQSHPFLQEFDIVFKQFSSATSYSGPAGIRLLKASCGQKSHQDLYESSNENCYLFKNLEKLGFETDFAMNHNGHFDDFLGMVKNRGGIETPLQSLQNIRIFQRSFDGTPIFDDSHVLSKWLKSRMISNSERRALYYNTISLHDGNKLVGNTRFKNSLDSYGARTEMLFKHLSDFFEKLQNSGRNYMVVLVPEHGASLAGDKMQIAGMRDIPSPSILDIPVGIKFIGENINTPRKQQVINKPSSYAAISELIARATRKSMFDGEINLPLLVADLPETPLVGENSGTKMQMFNGKPYIQLDDGEWMIYPGY